MLNIQVVVPLIYNVFLHCLLLDTPQLLSSILLTFLATLTREVTKATYGKVNFGSQFDVTAPYGRGDRVAGVAGS